MCADEKPSIQARARVHPTVATPAAGSCFEHEYERKGALCYLAAWDVRRARIFDRCAPKDGIEPFDALVEQFMSVEPYRSAQRVFVIVDNGSAHRGQRSIDRLQGAWPNLVLVHTPVHASWLNQAEVYFSVTQRKVLQPNNFTDLDELERTLLAFGRHYEQIARPFAWKFTRVKLQRAPRQASTSPPRCRSPRDPSMNFRRDHLGQRPPGSFSRVTGARQAGCDVASACPAHLIISRKERP